MIDHISIAVRDLASAAQFYEAVLGTLGYTKLIARPTTVGFGKKYPDFWINARPRMAAAEADSGMHICVRAPGREAVDAFYATALKAGGRSDGLPGPRPEYTPGYYAAFILDPDGTESKR